ncbi:hypothetical protein Q3G72_001654 [Acer saccharum]|nr:hypothetical protein Q3G72_001654 [Acer saccharum]
MDEIRSKYINWVDKVLELHRGKYINEFRIHFDLGDDQKSSITNWIHRALAEGVQKLELNFDNWFVITGKEYRFPVECYNTLTSSHGLSVIKSLRSLSLRFVQVNMEIVEFFLYNCPHLERLRVAWSNTLLSLKVVGSSIKLKHLDINNCNYINEVEISAPSLLSFKYHGPQIKLYIENVPLLLDVSIGGSNPLQLRNFIDPIILYLPQLETFELLINLKKLISGDHKRKLREFPKYPLEHLKVVEIVGFVGRPIDLELAFYFLENAHMLEKMTVNPTYSTGSYFKSKDSERKQAARNRAKLLKKRLFAMDKWLAYSIIGAVSNSSSHVATKEKNLIK